jgi:uncharacterized protein (TIGR02466 family)
MNGLTYKVDFAGKRAQACDLASGFPLDTNVNLDVGATLNKGLAHQQGGRLADAESAYRQVLVAQPGNVQALYLMATLAHQQGRDDSAAHFLWQAWESSGRTEYLVDWGRLILKQAGTEEVIRAFRQATERFPERAELHERLGSLYQMIGQGEAALTCYRQAVALDANLARAHANIGILLNQKDQIEETIAASTRATQLQPGDSLGHYSLGHALLKRGDLDAALASFRRAVELNPAWGSPHASIVETLLRQGDAAGAVRTANQAIGHLGYDGGIIAFQYYALNQLGETEAARTLLAFDRFTRRASLPVPPGYASLTELNQALVVELLAHPSLMWEPLGRTTRGGHQSTNLLERTTPALRAFLEVLRQVLDTYIADLPPDPGHPFCRYKPARYGLDIWSTILDSGGHQDPHIHTSGWLSGVYYVQLPDAMGTTKENNAGWIEFGRPPSRIAFRDEPHVFTDQPHEGLLILFPSYIFHRTLPFVDSKKRISIAFDVIP